MKTSQSFSFYPSDFLLGTMLLSTSETGAYIRLLCYQWQEGRLPDDLKLLARLAQANSADIEALLCKFELGRDGFRRNTRLEKVRKSLILYKKSRSDNGKKGGRPPKAQGKHMVSGSLDGGKHRESLPSPSPSPSPSPIPPYPQGGSGEGTDASDPPKATPAQSQTGGGSQKKKRGRQQASEDAMEIYRQYPRKVARDSALRAIEKRLDQGLSKEDLLDAVRNYAAAVAQWPRHDRERFVPYPASWFNGGRFADDPATWQRNDGLVPAKKEMGGSGSWAQRMNARDQAHEDELATLRVVPLHEPDPDWDWRSIARELYDFDFEDWHAVPFDNRKEIERAHNETSQPIPA